MHDTESLAGCVATAAVKIASGRNLSDEDLVREFAVFQWSPALCERLVAFIPLAFGRVCLEDAPPQFADEYLTQDPVSGRRESHPLASEPVFTLATDLARSWKDNGNAHDFECVATRSAEVVAVRQLVPDGGPATGVVLVEPLMLRLLPEASTKPWWRFW